MVSRRDFLKTSSLISLSPWVLTAFQRMACAAGNDKDAPVLVVIQLDGGNDGLNTVVPIGDDEYRRCRPKLALPKEGLHGLGDDVALHREMKAAKELFDGGKLAIVQGVSYPNPNRSHFESMRIWQSGYNDLDRSKEDGWLGRTLDGIPAASNDTSSQGIYTGGQDVPLALWGKRSTAIAMTDADDLRLELENLQLTRDKEVPQGASLSDFAVRQFSTAIGAAMEFAKKDGESKKASYPDSKLASQLRLISEVLQARSTARVFYATQTGYDTHADQFGAHGRLLREFAQALKAFQDDLSALRIDDRVIVLAFSEFGRRVEENDSSGTDHGTAGPVFVCGTPVRGGLIGQVPSLVDLEDGDLKPQFDFRQIYATVLENWMKIPSQKILGDSFGKLELFTG